jgi:hypothetical protein
MEIQIWNVHMTETNRPFLKYLMISEIKWFHLEKLTIIQLLKFLLFHGNQWFITMFTRSCPSFVSSHMNPAYILISYSCKIHLNIILPCTPQSPKWIPVFRFADQNSVAFLLSPMHAIWLNHLILHPFTLIISGDENKLSSMYKSFQHSVTQS